MKVLIASILSVVFSTLLLSQVSAAGVRRISLSVEEDESNMNKEGWLEPVDKPTVYEGQQKNGQNFHVSNVPFNLFHPEKENKGLFLWTEEGKLHLSPNRDTNELTYIVYDTVSDSRSESTTIKKGEEHIVPGDRFTFYFKK